MIQMTNEALGRLKGTGRDSEFHVHRDELIAQTVKKFSFVWPDARAVSPVAAINRRYGTGPVELNSGLPIWMPKWERHRDEYRYG